MKSCAICGTEKSKDVAICLDCCDKGYGFCKNDSCINTNKIFNKNEVNPDKFYIFDDLSGLPEKFPIVKRYFNEEHLPDRHYIDRKLFCSNKCYNLDFWTNNVGRLINLHRMEDILGLRELMKPINGKENLLPKISKEDIDDLEKFYQSKIEWIKNNL